MCLGVPGKIVELMENNMARVDIDGNHVEINRMMTPDVSEGQYVMIHAGFAMEIIDEEYARETLKLLLELEKIRESH